MWKIAIFSKTKVKKVALFSFPDSKSLLSGLIEDNWILVSAFTFSLLWWLFEWIIWRKSGFHTDNAVGKNSILIPFSDNYFLNTVP